MTFPLHHYQTTLSERAAAPCLPLLPVAHVAALRSATGLLYKLGDFCDFDFCNITSKLEYLDFERVQA